MEKTAGTFLTLSWKLSCILFYLDSHFIQFKGIPKGRHVLLRSKPWLGLAHETPNFRPFRKLIATYRSGAGQTPRLSIVLGVEPGLHQAKHVLYIPPSYIPIPHNFFVNSLFSPPSTPFPLRQLLYCTYLSNTVCLFQFFFSESCTSERPCVPKQWHYAHSEHPLLCGSLKQPNLTTSRPQAARNSNHQH